MNGTMVQKAMESCLGSAVKWSPGFRQVTSPSWLGTLSDVAHSLALTYVPSVVVSGHALSSITPGHEQPEGPVPLPSSFHRWPELLQ